MADAVRVDPTRVEAREVEGELVILDLAGQRYLGGNRAAARLWPLLCEGATRTELAAKLAAEFEVDEATARDDVDRLVDSLSELDLLDD